MRKSKVISLILALVIFCSFAVDSFASNKSQTTTSAIKPSVVRKEVTIVPTKEILDVKQEDGTYKKEEVLVYAYIVEIMPKDGDPFDPEFQKILKYLGKLEVVVTPYSRRDNVVSEKLSEKQKENIKDNLENAYLEINSVFSLAELNEILDPRAAQIDPSYDGRVFVVTDLFDVTVIDEYNRLLTSSDRIYIKLTLNVGLTEESIKPVVMHLPTGSDKWQVIDDKQVEVNDEYNLTIYFDTLCPIAILMPVPDRMEEEYPYKRCNCPSWCPFCSFACKNHHCLCWLCWIILFCIIVLLVRYICKQIKKEKEEREAQRQYQAMLHLEQMEIKDKWDEINKHLDDK